MKPALIGHAKIKAQIEKALSSQSLHSTLLFSGPEGIGKKLVALELAKSLLCEKPLPLGGCRNCRSCQVFDSRNHPDFVCADLLDKDTWNVEGVRGLLASIQVKPYMQHGRVVIFDNAHALTIAASNILLKTFEEPQKGNTFIIISSNPSKLPITLRSRCQVWGFHSLAENELSAILSREAGVQDVPAEILSLADGSIGNAKLLLDSHDLVSDIREMIMRLKDADVGFSYESVVAWAKQKEDLPRVLHISRLVARNALLTTQNPQEKALWAVFLEDLNAAEWALFDRNLNPLLVLLNVFLRLVPHKVRGHSFTQLALDDTLGTLIRI